MSATHHHEESSTTEEPDSLSESVKRLETLTWTKLGELMEESEKMPSDIAKQLLKYLATWTIKHSVPLEERNVPTGRSYDLDGLCIVGKVGSPLSFVDERRKSDDDLIVWADPKSVPKFTGGKRQTCRATRLTLPSSGKQKYFLGRDKYGCGEECQRSGLLGNGRSQFYCFGQLSGYLLYCSMEEEEKEEFWKDILLPSVEKALPDRKRVGSFPREDGKYVLGREASFVFLREMKAKFRVSGEAWKSATTLALRLGQKSSAWPPGKSPFECTFGPCESQFTLEGADSIFWSAGCNLIFEGEEASYCSFWKSEFLEEELRGDRSSERKGSLYKLMGTNSLASSQSKFAPPSSFVLAWKRLRSSTVKAHRDAVEAFDLETFQIYSTMVYYFKGCRGGKVAGDPSSPAWRERASSLAWVKANTSGREPQKKEDPLTAFVNLVESLPEDGEGMLRVEPTMFLRFERNASGKAKRAALKKAFEETWDALGDHYGGLCSDAESSEGVHETCFWTSATSRLACMAKIYREATSEIRAKALVRKFWLPRETNVNRPFPDQEGKASLPELEVLDFAEFSPFGWLTGKTWKVVPKVAEQLMVLSSTREQDFPSFPESLFLPGGLREKMARSILSTKPSSTPSEKESKWLPQDSTLTRLPQAWFHSRRSPSTSRFRRQVSLLLEFKSVLDDPRAGCKKVVENFCLLFAFCCMVKSKSWMVEDEESEGSEEESEGSEGEAHVPSTQAVSLSQVKAELARRSGPLFDDASSSGKTVKLWNLLTLLFDNAKVHDAAYRRNKADVWVEALGMVKSVASASPPRTEMAALKEGGNFLSLACSCWKETLGFSRFWHCSAGSFAKSPSPLLSVEFEDVTLEPSTFHDVAGQENAARLNKVHFESLVEEVVEKITSLFKGTLTSSYVGSDKPFRKLLVACCRCTLLYASSNGASSAKSVTFAVACFLRLLPVLGNFPKAALSVSKEVAKSFDKSVQHHKIKAESLAVHTPFFQPVSPSKKRTKLVVLPWEKVLEGIETLSK